MSTVLASKAASVRRRWASPKAHHPVEAFFFQTAVKAFEVGIAIGGLCRQQDGRRAGIFQNGANGLAKLRIAIHEKIALPVEKARTAKESPPEVRAARGR